jgi:hypothetical protein
MNANSTYFAFRSSAGKEVRGLALIILENDIGFEKVVDGRAPMLLECL